jgi:two-component system response regulator GlrR
MGSLSAMRVAAVPGPTIVVCGCTSAEVETVARIIRESLGWAALPVCWPDRDALRAASDASPRGFVQVGAGPDVMLDELAARRGSLPLLLVGGEPRADRTPSCWLPSVPPAGLLATLLSQLVGAQASSTRKRKSDLIIGRSPAIGQLLAMLDRVAGSTAPVLVTGESGTGKDLVARAMHYSGPRAAGPFIAVNCAAIPETLFESELFGHARGAFTGAAAARGGVFEAADGGTLFLDEIGELPLLLQPKLLRALETGQVTRLGSTEVRSTSVRLVAATNRPLEQQVADGLFREDLYYRIRVFHVPVPPLRERPEDIPPLVSHYLGTMAARDRRPIPILTGAALEKLVRHRWPGNVRELVNALERAMVHAPPGGSIEAEHIQLPDDAPPMVHAYRDAKGEFETRYYAQLLRAADGNVSLAAKLAGRTRAQIYEALRRLELAPESFREGEEDESS